MAKDPAFLFYSSDFFIGTFSMTDAQVGQYVRLLCLQHQNGHLSEEMMTEVMRGKFDEKIACKFLVDENRCYYNKRLDEEMDKRNSYTESRRRNLSATPTHMQKHMDEHMPQHMENENVIVNVDVIDTVDDHVITNTVPPKIEDVRAYCLKRGNGIDPEKFVDYYEMRGWMAGRSKMKNWQSAVHTWEKNGYSSPTKTDAPMNWVRDEMKRKGEE